MIGLGTIALVTMPPKFKYYLGSKWWVIKYLMLEGISKLHDTVIVVRPKVKLQ
jgi:hypothetical protein